MKYDVAVIGAGPGGYVSAIRASQLGKKCVVIEKDKPGGICLNWGCIPSKSLIHQAEVFCEAKKLSAFGAKLDTTDFKYELVQKSSRKVTEKITRGVSNLLKKNKIDYVRGEACFTSPHSLQIRKSSEDSSASEGMPSTDSRESRSDDLIIEADNIIVATGSSPREIPNFEFDEEKVLSSTGILKMQTIPKSLIILGAGAIGMEFAYVMNSFGVEVTIVEMLDRVLPLEDESISSFMKKSFTQKGINLYLGTKATKLDKEGKGLRLTIEKEGTSEVLVADAMLVSVGRVPNTTGIGLEKLGVLMEKGFVQVDDYGMTNIKGIYAIGDIVGTTPQLAHVASKEGEIAAEHICGKHPHSIDRLAIPSAVYCQPEVASFGYNSHAIEQNKIPAKVSEFPYVGAGKTLAIDKADGFVKLITHQDTGEILGAHIVGHNATEIIHILLLASSKELLNNDVAEMIFAHPTVSETVMEVARESDGWAIHK